MRETADLHMHTDRSDGKDDMEDRVSQANEEGLDTIAITDHDTVGDHFEGRIQMIDGVEVISGAELKAEIDGNRIEILAYFIDPDDPELEDLVEDAYGRRKDRIETISERLDEQLSREYETGFRDSDIKIDSEEVLEKGGGIPTRNDVAEELIRQDLCGTVSEAFQEYIGSDSYSYVPSDKISAERVLETMDENGAVTSLAHPGRDLNSENIDDVVRELADLGLDAIEVPYTYHQREEGYDLGFEPEEASYTAAKMAGKYDLKITGGSDCHGELSEEHYIGEIHFPGVLVEELRPDGSQYRL